MRTGFHAVLDKRVNEYISPHGGTTPYLLLAYYFISPTQAAAWLTQHGFSNVLAKHLLIGSVDTLPLITFHGAAKAAAPELQTVQAAADADAKRAKRIRARMGSGYTEEQS